MMNQVFAIKIPLLILLTMAGCGSNPSLVPVPISKRVPFSYKGQIGIAWGGDNFEVIEDGHLHYAFIRGIDTPEPGQEFFEEAKELLLELTQGSDVTVNVIERDQWQREVCEISIDDGKGAEKVDPCIILLQRGLAWYDNSELPKADQYKEIEAEARSKKIGIWSRPDPIPPWEFWNHEVRKVRKAVSGEK